MIRPKETFNSQNERERRSAESLLYTYRTVLKISLEKFNRNFNLLIIIIILTVPTQGLSVQKIFIKRYRSTAKKYMG